MAGHNGFVTHVLDLLQGLGDASARAMFGAHGIYVDGMIIALVEDDTLYLKVDDVNRGRFEEAGGRPFTYHDKAGQPRSMSYWTVPDHVLDDAGAMVDWARTSLDAAKRAKAPARKTTVKTAPKPVKAAKTAKSPKAAAKRSPPAKPKAEQGVAPRPRTAPAAKAARASKSKRS